MGDTATKALQLAQDADTIFQTQSGLWEEAFKTLTKSESASLDFQNPSLQDLRAALQDATAAHGIAGSRVEGRVPWEGAQGL